jgi:hypothetical protein
VSAVEASFEGEVELGVNACNIKRRRRRQQRGSADQARTTSEHGKRDRAFKWFSPAHAPPSTVLRTTAPQVQRGRVRDDIFQVYAATMTDATPGATAAPPKKRSFFKKAAWQTKVKPEGEKEQDIFSHSKEFSDVVAEQAKRKQQEKKLKEEEKKRKHEEERERKRRRISDEVVEDSKPLKSGSRSSPRTNRKESKGCVFLPVHQSPLLSRSYS